MNIHDLIAANVVRNAFAAEKLPPGAASVVVGATRAAGMPMPQKPEPAAAAQTPPSRQDAPDVRQEIAAQLSARMASQYDGIITAMLRERVATGQVDTADPKELDVQGRLRGFSYPDGRTEWELDGQTLVEFLVPQAGFSEDGRFMEVALVYRVAIPQTTP